VVGVRLEPGHDRLLFDGGRWRRRAACREMGPELFFPVGERDADAVAQAAEAKQVCARCDVRLHCLAYSLVANPEYGIWGGLGPSERRALRRARRARHQTRGTRTKGAGAATAPVANHAARSMAL